MCQDIKVTIDRQFPLMTEWQVLHFLFLNWLAHLISISPREWWNRQGHYAKPSLEYALTLMLVSITVLSNWLYFILSVFFKACFFFNLFNILKAFKKESMCSLHFKNSQVPHMWLPRHLPASPQPPSTACSPGPLRLFPRLSGSWDPLLNSPPAFQFPL